MMEQLGYAIDIAKRAGTFVKGMKGHVAMSEKKINDLVTDADIASQKMIRDALLKQFPDTQFFGEEDESRPSLDSNGLWIVDPLDGTNNYAQGLPVYCVSIAYASKGEVLCGCIYDPERDELFSAQKGGGAYLNGNKISVSARSTLQESMAAVGFYYDRGELMEKTLCSIHALFKNNVRGIRRMGSAAIDLSWLACGRFDAYFEYTLSPWDFAAGMLIVREAGGTLNDRDGGSFSLTSNGVIASNGRFQEELVSMIGWSKVNNCFAND